MRGGVEEWEKDELSWNSLNFMGNIQLEILSRQVDI